MVTKKQPKGSKSKALGVALAPASAGLSERAMLSSLNISRWAATRTDKKISQEVATNHKVSEKRAGHYRKHAIDLDADTYKAVITAASEMRNAHYELTLPWGQDGARILPSALFQDYSEKMRGLKTAFNRAVAAFVADYPKLKSQAKQELNGLYNENDYPTNIAAKFGAEWSIMPMPSEQDFRARLTEDAVSEIQKGIREQLDKTLTEAMREPYQRLYDHISRMVERLSDKKGIFRDTLITGLADLCTLLPGLNLTKDERLDELRLKAEEMIANVEPQTLRDVPAVRRNVAKKAAEIQDIMSAFMGPPSAAEEAA